MFSSQPLTRPTVDPRMKSAALRSVIGLAVADDCRTLRGAVVSAQGSGPTARTEVVAGATADISAATADLYAGIHGDRPVESIAKLALLRNGLADTQSALIQQLLAAGRMQPTDVMAIGVTDPGCWYFDELTGASYTGFCAATRLAESSGVSVIDDFPARDIARGGGGKPLDILPLWLLLADRRIAARPRTRLLVDLGDMSRLLLLPPPEEQGKPPTLALSQTRPGMALVERIAERLTDGRQPDDSGGRLAVQGRCLPDLLDHWKEDPLLANSFGRPADVSVWTGLIDIAYRQASERKWAIQDVLCTATHLVAEGVAAAVEEWSSEETPIHQILLTGRGRQNGLLLRQLDTRLPDVRQTQLAQLGVEDDWLEPACVAVLALLHVQQIPANLPSLTGADVARVLGRLTPGNPINWQRLLREMTANQPATLPLRSAM